jgi:putative ABC transport system permease protein
MGDLVRAFRLSFRSLARSPGFTVPALLILAIGMTAATAIFTVVDSILLRPLGLPDAGRLVIVCEDHPSIEGYCIASPTNVEDFRRGTDQLTDLGIARTWPYAMLDGATAEGVNGGLASAGFFRALGVQPVVGRLFSDDEHGPDRDKVVVLSHAYWITHFGADPEVVGRVLNLDGSPNEVVGVLPSGLEPPFDLAAVELWKPPHFDPLDPDIRRWRGFRAVGRLAPGATVASATDELRGVYAGIAENHEEVNDEWRLRVTPLLREVVGDTRPVLIGFLGAAGLLLLIVCANVANLILARGLGRRRELAVRSALGAARGTLVWGILGESLVLTALATAGALLLAGGATRLLLLLAPPEIPRLDEVAMNGTVLGFSVLVCVTATVLFALLPALRVTAWDLASTIKSGGREGESRGSNRLRASLVVAELALSVILLATAGVVSRSFAAYLAWEPGFDRSSLIAVSAFANWSKYGGRAEIFEMWRQAEEQVAVVPGVTSVATGSAGPLFGGGDGATPYLVEGADEAGVHPSVWWFDVGPRYFSTLGVSVLEGREITEADGLDVTDVAVVNETMARSAWPSGSALGRTLRFPEREGMTVQIVGVVADVPPLTPGEPAHPEIYWSNRQNGRPATFFLVRTNGDPASFAKSIADAILSVDPDVSLGTPLALSSSERRRLVKPRFEALVLLAFALAALALSAVGVYAVVSYAVARRVREMGVRLALGARGPQVVGLVVRSSLPPALIGISVGLAGALLAGRVTGSMVHGVSPSDPLSLGGAVLLLLGVAVLAAWVPARRATRVDPIQAMRAE